MSGRATAKTRTNRQSQIDNRYEAGAGIEPANSGFADRDLTTWLPRRTRADNIVVAALVSSAERRKTRARRAEYLTIFPFNSSAPKAFASRRFKAPTNPLIVAV